MPLIEVNKSFRISLCHICQLFDQFFTLRPFQPSFLFQKQNRTEKIFPLYNFMTSLTSPLLFKISLQVSETKTQ